MEMSTETAAAGGVTSPGGQFFARRATGFVRQVRILDATILNALSAGAGFVLAVSVFWILSAFTGVNLFVAIAIAAVCSFIVSGAFGLLSQMMPRSGGDYVLISRALHPALGLGSSILICMACLLSVGYFGVLSAQILVGPSLTIVGIAAGSGRLVSWGTSISQTPGDFIYGLAQTAIVIGIMIWSMRLMQRLQLILFSAGILGLAVAAVVFVTTSTSHFIRSFNSFARPYTHRGDTYHYLLAQAHAAGVATGGATSWSNTIVASGAIIAFGVWTWWSISYAGEMRQASTLRNWYSMLGGLALTFVPLAVVIGAMYLSAGHSFLVAANAVSSNAKVYTLPVPPYWMTLAAALHPNTVFAIFLALTFMAWGPLFSYLNVLYPSRVLFAWSFDQVIPSEIAEVNPRTHTPVRALVAIGIISIPFLYLTAYTHGIFKVIALVAIVVFPVFFMIGLSALIFPRRHPEIYEASSANIKVLGVPLITLFGIGTIGVAVFGAWLFLTHAPLGLPNGGSSMWSQLFTSPFNGGLSLIVCCLAAGGLLYVIAKAWRQSQDVDLSLNYRVIPPE
jgi:amino acid transporter